MNKKYEKLNQMIDSNINKLKDQRDHLWNGEVSLVQEGMSLFREIMITGYQSQLLTSKLSEKRNKKVTLEFQKTLLLFHNRMMKIVQDQPKMYNQLSAEEKIMIASINGIFNNSQLLNEVSYALKIEDPVLASVIKYSHLSKNQAKRLYERNNISSVEEVNTYFKGIKQPQKKRI